MFPQKTIDLIVEFLNKYGITNKNIQIGVLAVVSTEGGFKPKSEMSYRNTPNKRLRSLFGSRLPATEDELERIKKDDVAFFDLIYGKKYGNMDPGDGFKYRGRGMNQITFKNLYKQYGDVIGVDLVSNPDRLNEIPIAAEVLAVYFRDTIPIGFKTGIAKKRYKVAKYSEIKDLEIGIKVAFSANVGWAINWALNSSLVSEHEKQIKNAQVLKNQVK